MPCYYRTVEADDSGTFFKFTPESFTTEYAQMFREKFAQLFSLSNVVLASEGAAYGKESSGSEKYGLQDFIWRISQAGNNTFDTLDVNDTKMLEEYFKYFAFSVNDKAEIVPGWIYQLKASVGGGKFIFRNEAFISNVSEFSRISKSPGTIFEDSEKDKNWKGGGLFSSQYDAFIDDLKKSKVSQDQNYSSLKEQFIAYLYNAVRTAHNFES